MQAIALYDRLASRFIQAGITDLNWAAKMPGLDKYLDEGFRRSGMGLMCDFAEEVEQVYTTVFLSDRVLSKILSENTENAMIFSHHPTNWGIEYHNGNYAATEEYIAELQKRKISIYVLHHPLDHYGEYSTGKTLANSIGMNIERPAFLYCGALCGVIGTVDCQSIGQLHEQFSKAMGHKTSLYPYGREDIQGEKIAVCPGGGNAAFVIEEMLEHGIRTLITGVTIVNDYSKEVHEAERKSGINVLGGTHYATERFAPKEMCKYFGSLGLPAGFVDDEPDLFDL